MSISFFPSQLFQQFPSNEACLEEMRRLRYPHGIHCLSCDKVTKHYKITGRPAYSCEFCRHQVYPLKNSIFEKSTTSLQTWFFCMYLLVFTRGKVSAKKIEKELGVTYKTAWRMRRKILLLMKQNHADLLKEPQKVLSVSFWNAFELKVVEKQEAS